MDAAPCRASDEVVAPGRAFGAERSALTDIARIGMGPRGAHAERYLERVVVADVEAVIVEPITVRCELDE